MVWNANSIASREVQLLKFYRNVVDSIDGLMIRHNPQIVSVRRSFVVIVVVGGVVTCC